MERNIMQELIQWKNMGSDRMPLVLHGVRQVGKTYILREFGDRFFQNTIYINFERMSVIAEYFSGELSPDRIIRLLEEYYSQKIIPDKTLIIFDEIQACERALTSLKYFCEEAPEYHIAAAGSLLGVAIHREKYSFPVGKVIIKTLYPLCFDEFLHAVGKGYFVNIIKEHCESMKEISAAAHQELLEWYYRYLFIGGMPAAVNEYIARESLINVPEVQSLILNAYMSMPAQLAKENKKFQYKLIRKGATAGLFGDSIAWLSFSGVVLPCNRVSRGDAPLISFRDVSSFKLYLSDVGLLSAFTEIPPESIIRKELSELYRGSLAENYVAQTLKAKGYELYYWTSDSPVAEVDFLIQKQGKVIPIEVKSGEHVRAKSLRHFAKMYKSEKVIRLSEKNFGTDGEICALPLYAAFCI